MTLQEQINKDFMTAYKAKDFNKKNFLGVLKGAIQNESTKDNFNADSTSLKIATKMAKNLKENLVNGDEATIEASKLELTYLDDYLPTLMEESKVNEIVAELIAGGANNMGLVMREFNTTYKGQADNNMVKTAVLSQL